MARGMVAAERCCRLHGGEFDVGADTAARYRETLLYNRYQAARDNIRRFEQGLRLPMSFPVCKPMRRGTVAGAHHAGERD